MKISKTIINGVIEIETDVFSDNRGSFSRKYCSSYLASQNIRFNISQCNSAFTKEKFTLRGLHYQIDEYKEDKLIFCTNGTVWDVVVDLRKKSKTFGKYFATKISAKNKKQLIIPKGCAHGYLTLTKNVNLVYFVTNNFKPEKERVLLWSDPELSIDWPKNPVVISDKDKNGKTLFRLKKEMSLC